MDVFEQTKAIASALEAKYTLKGRDLTYEEIFATHGLMPAIAKRADQLSSLALGYGIGMIVKESEKTMLGRDVNFDDQTPNVTRMLCIADVLIDLMKGVGANGKLALDELLTD